MIKKIMAVFGVMGLSILASPVFSSEGVTGNVNFNFVSKALVENDWAPVDAQTGVGLDADLKKKGWPFSVAFGYQTTDASDTDPFSGIDLKGKTTELSLGAKWIGDKTPVFRPFVGGGLCQVKGEFEAPGFGVSDSDTAIGYWLSGGLYWTLANHFNLGINARYSKANISLFGVDVDAGGVSMGLLLGYHY
jgi:opacity protein-like surface antigen